VAWNRQIDYGPLEEPAVFTMPQDANRGWKAAGNCGSLDPSQTYLITRGDETVGYMADAGIVPSWHGANEFERANDFGFPYTLGTLPIVPVAPPLDWRPWVRLGTSTPAVPIYLTTSIGYT
ncbi:unnamed protein product, partial [Symbiodinium pilosum]